MIDAEERMEELLVISKLVRMSVFGTSEDIPAGVDWPKVFADAGVNGVSALCYEAVKTLPQDKQPDFGLMLQWDLSSQGICEGFRHRIAVTRKLGEMLGSNGIVMLLLKGVILAENYPDPELRESGDVDFVALDADDRSSAFDKCNALAGSLGTEITCERKHSSFDYCGVHFENHTLEPMDGYNRVHHNTLALIRESLPNAGMRPDGCLAPDPLTQAVYAVKHTAQHVCYSGGRINLKMLLDLALLLNAHPEVADEWEPVLRRVGLHSFARTMLRATDLLLGTGFSSDRSSRTRRRAERFIRLFLTDSNPVIRYFAKLSYLPLRPSEVLRMWYEKAASTIMADALPGGLSRK